MHGFSTPPRSLLTLPLLFWFLLGGVARQEGQAAPKIRLRIPSVRTESQMRVSPEPERLHSEVVLGFNVRITYATRDWKWEPVRHETRYHELSQVAPPIAEILLGHKYQPLSVNVLLERVDLGYDPDPRTLAKMVRFNYEVNAQQRVTKETLRVIGGVEGMELELTQLAQGALLATRIWVAQHNGELYQIMRTAPYQSKELLDRSDYPFVFDLVQKERNRPVRKESEVPRSFESSYGYRVTLPDGDWIPGVRDASLPAAEFVAMTRNQGGVFVLPVSLLGQSVDPSTLHGVLFEQVGLPKSLVSTGSRPVQMGAASGVAFGGQRGGNSLYSSWVTTRVVSHAQGAFVLQAWVNTNAPISALTLESWLDRVVISAPGPGFPAQPTQLKRREEGDFHAELFQGIGEAYFVRKDYQRSSSAFQVAMNTRGWPESVTGFVEADLRRGKPAETLNALLRFAPYSRFSMSLPVEIAYVKSKAGQTHEALVEYTRAISSRALTGEQMSPPRFDDYVRCLVKENRKDWAIQRLESRLRERDPDQARWGAMVRELQDTGKLLPADDAWADAPLRREKVIMPFSAKPEVVVHAPASPARPPTEAKPSPPPASPRAPNNAPPTASGATAAADGPKLTGIIWSARKPRAQFGPRLVVEGDTMAGYTVLKIEKESVELLTPTGAKLLQQLK